MNKAYETHKQILVIAPFAVVTGTKYSYSDKVGTGTLTSAVGIDCKVWRKAKIIQTTGVKAAADTCILSALAGPSATNALSDAVAIPGLDGSTVAKSIAPLAAGIGSSLQDGEIDLTAMAGRYLFLKMVSVGASAGTIPTSVTVTLSDPIVAPGGDTVNVVV